MNGCNTDNADDTLIFDCEWAGGFRRPTKVHCIVITPHASGTLEVYSEDDVVQGVARLQSGRRIVGHNIIAADLHVLRWLFGYRPEGVQEVVDTLVLSRLLNPDRQRPYGLKGKVGPHSIAAYAHRLGGGDYAKVEIEEGSWDVFTPDMLERCKRDVLVNDRVYSMLLQEARK